MLRFLLTLLALFPLSLLVACGGDDEEDGGFTTDYPGAGEDVFDNTTAVVEIAYEPDLVSAAPRAQELERIELEGPARVTRSDPQDQDGDGLAEIKTEVVEMELRGTASFGAVIVREREDKESVGLVEQQEAGTDFPADSYFEMFVQIELPTTTGSTNPSGPADMVVRGQPSTVFAITEGPMRMEATITDLPPGKGDRYESADGQEVPLVAVNDATLRLGRIVDALHVPNPDGDATTEEPTEEPTGDSGAATASPGGVPTAEVDQTLGCEHTQPGVQSDLVDLIFAYLVALSGASDANGEQQYVLQLVSGDGNILYGPETAQTREPLGGVTVNATAAGPGAIAPDQQGVTDAEGAVRLRFPINRFGEYEVVVGSVQAPDRTIYQAGQDSEQAVRFTVGEVCELPPGF